jgi:NAD(P)-dependent dehydrogenase (short-subunit alcohol dehydrogenase family)
MNIELGGRVAIVTGAGGGLGRSHALALARHGARVVVNDAGGARDGRDGSSGPAEAVAAEIRAAGGVAQASCADVTDAEQMAGMVAAAEAAWGRVDILVNNAGILRDRTFAKMDLADFRAVIEVHLMGSVNATKAVWAGMCARGHGRIVMTTSSSGLYGNFGQSNYGSAKMALVGLMRTLSLEGQRHDVRVNCLAPSAATRMTADIMSAETLELLSPEAVSPTVVALAADDAPTGSILCAGAGSVERAHITLTRGLRIAPGSDAAGQILAGFDTVSNRTGEMVPASGPEQAQWELANARRTERAA